MADARIRVTIDGRDLELSNLDKVLYPAAGYTKGEVVDYYTRVAPVLLPALRDRPLTRIRYPNGVDGVRFYEKNTPAGTPGWVRLVRLPVPGSTMHRDTIDFVLVDDLATLVWVANLAALELHTPQWRVDQPGPDLLVIDLDPGPGTGLAECARVALRVRDRLAADGIASYPKTSGRKGMQLCCPIAGVQPATEVLDYARRVAYELERAAPADITARMAKNLRPGKVFIDWSQNNAAKNTIVAYSLRAQPEPTVSTPLSWAEVQAGELSQFGPAEVLARIQRYGDLAAPAGGGAAVPVPG